MSGGGTWAIATGLSLALHGAAGFLLFAMPVPTPAPARETRIEMAVPDAGVVTASGASDSARVVTARQAAVAVSTPVQASAAIEASAIRPSTSPVVAAAKPVAADTLAATSAPVATSPLATIQAPEAAAAQPVAPASDDPSVTPTTDTLALAAAESAPLPGAAVDATAPAAVRTPESVAPAAAPSELASALEGAALLPADTGAKVPVTIVPVPAHPPESVSTVAPPSGVPAAPAPVVTVPEPATPGQSVSAQPSAARPAAVAAVRPTEPAATGVRVAPARVAAAPRAAPATAAPTVVASAPAVSAVTAAEPSQPDGQDEPVEQAMLARPNEAGGGGQHALRIGDFLAARGDGPPCMLAVPTSMGSREASIDAFSAAPGPVDALKADYERASGVSLAATTKLVAEPQCVALVFARNLAQYPNFPLKLTLNDTTIRSGDDLTGVVSGLRKSNLYLFIVDDEGKAQLLKSYDGMRASVATFSAPMTLTAGPVSSVQLLIAIATDGPLRTVPPRPGIPADEFFSRLMTEIIGSNRSILYGITSFFVE
jgi:hypothetical protein